MAAPLDRRHQAGDDKAYGIRKLRDILGIPLSEMVFIETRSSRRERLPG